MTADSSQVIVTTGSTAHAVQVYHRDIPELRADGESPELKAAPRNNFVICLVGLSWARSCSSISGGHGEA